MENINYRLRKRLHLRLRVGISDRLITKSLNIILCESLNNELQSRFFEILSVRIYMTLNRRPWKT